MHDFSCIHTIGKSHDWPINSLVVTLEGDSIISASRDRTVKMWNLEEGSCFQTLIGHTGSILALAVGLNNELVSGSFDKTIKIWNTDTGKCVRTFYDHDWSVNCIVISKKSGFLVSGSDDNTCKVFDITNSYVNNKQTLLGKKLNTFFGHGSSVTGLVITGEDLCISADRQKIIYIWNIHTAECFRTIHLHGVSDFYVLSLALVQTYVRIYKNEIEEDSILNGKLICGLSDSTMKVLDLADDPDIRIANFAEKPMYSGITLTSHRKYVKALAVSPSGELISASADKTLKIWQIGENVTKCLNTLYGHDDYVVSLAVSRNGKIMSGSYGGNILIWNIKKRED